MDFDHLGNLVFPPPNHGNQQCAREINHIRQRCTRRPANAAETHERYLLIRGMPYKTVVAPILAADAVMDKE
jgi:hypothetical protein